MTKTFGITSHSVVINEERWIWYSLNSALPFVDRMLVTDVGSTDRTIEIIKSIKSPKIELSTRVQHSPQEQVRFREEQLEKTQTPWFLILDGDEIWPKESLGKLSKQLNSAGDSIFGVVTPTVNFLGDLTHIEEPRAGRYSFLGRRGHLAMRAMRKLPGMHLTGTYPLEDYVLADGLSLTKTDEHLIFLEAPYCHMTNLPRSDSRSRDRGVIARRYKLEIGDRLPPGFNYPEVFFRPHPAIVSDPWIAQSVPEKILSYALTPWRRLKRRFL